VESQWCSKRRVNATFLFTRDCGRKRRKINAPGLTASNVSLLATFTAVSRVSRSWIKSEVKVKKPKEAQSHVSHVSHGVSKVLLLSSYVVF